MSMYICNKHGETEYYQYGERKFCKQCSKDRAKESESRNPGASSKRAARWIADNRGRYLEKKKEYREKNKKRIKKQVSRWKMNNRDSLINASAKRRALKRNCEINDFTVSQWQELLKEYDNKCAYCGIGGVMTQDHMTPLSRAGNHTKNNIVPACLRCNMSKHTKTKEEYLDGKSIQ